MYFNRIQKVLKTYPCNEVVVYGLNNMMSLIMSISKLPLDVAVADSFDHAMAIIRDFRESSDNSPGAETGKNRTEKNLCRTSWLNIVITLKRWL
jgi:hypothetical protein